MAIIKISNGKSNVQDAIEEGEFIFFDRSKNIKKSGRYLFDGEYVIVAGEGDFTPRYFYGKFDLHQRSYAITSNNENLKVLYLFYYITKMKFNFTNLAVGSTVPSLRLSSFEWINNAIFPSIETQKSIIDIIEPINTMILNIKNQIKILELWLSKTSNSLKETTILLKSKVNFEKGKIVPSSKFKNFGTPFIDIRMLNSSTVSKYVDYNQNVFYGDILLSLDGTIGIVKYNVNGFNGYAYNVKSNQLSKIMIYLNLINNKNQGIISQNSRGTTIKHASSAKEKMIYFEVDESTKLTIEILYKLVLNLNKQLNNLTQIKELQIKLLIK